MIFDRVSADGYFSDARGGLEWATPDPQLDGDAAQRLSGTGTILFGRTTYDQFESFWPHALDDSGTSPSPHGPERRSKDLHAMAVWINNATKIVFSKRREAVTWNNSRLVREIDAREIAALKAEPGGDIMVFGSGSVVSRLTELGLVDEYQLVIAPVLLGAGRSLIAGIAGPTPLRLVEATPYPSGNVRLRYVRAE